MYFTLPITNCNFSVTFISFSTDAFCLDKSKILIFGIELNFRLQMLSIQTGLYLNWGLKSQLYKCTTVMTILPTRICLLTPTCITTFSTNSYNLLISTNTCMFSWKYHNSYHQGLTWHKTVINETVYKLPHKILINLIIKHYLSHKSTNHWPDCQISHSLYS